ncbi:hypothetical protein A9264_05810 [Vibrio sp. UCD-FRSSP16_10]|uniref:DUF2861 family protein n=1 Tax=unclassified Vibrio TaxID=2614977 RepID=UPI0008022D59|nr:MULTISPECIES: DUF2861 family protein [unclassified Vibrio]OBT07982.1 hypothetical protein A9260_08050 [Vibrio sp. UCD-FRSSP16_30]OBT17157.1 hypothetical protein A9264_05810 [Vibrio sp. UCD-FRSSP16_10]
MKPFLTTLLLIPLAAPIAANAQWFEENNIVTRMHQKLLEDDLNGMFEIMVQVWQQESTDNLHLHLDALLKQATEQDCGKSLTAEGLPNWVDSVSIEKISVQRPGRLSNKLMLSFLTDNRLVSVKLIGWPDSIISQNVIEQRSYETTTDDKRTLQYTEATYSLSKPLKSGLYQLQLEDTNQHSWTHWLIMSDADPVHVVRWDSKDSWIVDKKRLLNRYCPLPVQKVTVYDYQDGKYNTVWNKSYESNYPVRLPSNALPPDRYVVSVSMTQSQWQGPILFKDKRTISKTIDFTEE